MFVRSLKVKPIFLYLKYIGLFCRIKFIFISCYCLFCLISVDEQAGEDAADVTYSDIKISHLQQLPVKQSRGDLILLWCAWGLLDDHGVTKRFFFFK